MKSFRLASVLVLAGLAAACNAQSPDAADDSDTDDLSPATVSMAMVRANPALAPSVVVPDGRYVPGRARALPAEVATPSRQGWGQGNPAASWLYAANQLNQFTNLTDPKMDADGKKVGAYDRKPGDLFADDGKYTWLNVEQGYLGDCYFAASLSAVLFADNGGALTRNLVKPVVENGKVVDFVVTFFQAGGRKVAVKVDPDLPHRTSSGHVLYLRSTDNKDGYEEWAGSLIEKAYATWHGSYPAIGNGGTAADAIYALTGKRTRSYAPTAAATITAIEAAGKAGRAQVACTYGDHDGVKYPTGLYSDHCYTLRGVVRRSGKVFVQLRNPWGPGSVTDSEPTEPPDADGVPDALFDLEVSQFQKLYASVDIVP